VQVLQLEVILLLQQEVTILKEVPEEIPVIHQTTVVEEVNHNWIYKQKSCSDLEQLFYLKI
jgi:hypothetical protein